MQVEKDFKDWAKLALKVSSTCPRLAVILACAGLRLEPEKEDKFYEIGLNIIKSQNGFHYAHLCFLLGSCDLNFVADKILTLSSHIECQRLAARYMITNKTNGLKNLEARGKKAVDEKKLDMASIFYLALIKHHFSKEDGDSVIRTLAKILPPNKLWKAVQAIVADIPELALNSEAVAEITIARILKDLGKAQHTSMESILALCGALHILYGDKELYDKTSETILQRIESMINNLLEGGAEFIVVLARIPGILPVIKNVLERKR